MTQEREAERAVRRHRDKLECWVRSFTIGNECNQLCGLTTNQIFGADILKRARDHLRKE